MSQENIDTVRRGYEAMNDRDYSRVGEFLHSDVEVDVSRNVLNPDVYHGHDGFVRLVSVIEDVWDDFRIEAEELIDGGDQVVVQIRIVGKGKGSGAPAEMRVFNVWTLRDAKATRLVGGFRDREEALEFAGLSEQGD